MHRLAVLLLAFASVSLRAATANQQAKVVKDAQAIAEAQASLLAMGASALTIQDSVSSGTLTTDLGKGPATVIEKRKIICVVPGSKKSRFEQYREAWKLMKPPVAQATEENTVETSTLETGTIETMPDP